jgi:membrane-bound lytic murein transglycosylase F
VREQLVYRRGDRRPRTLDDIPPFAIQVIAGSAHEETLRQLHERHPALQWIARHHIGLHTLLEGVEAGSVRFTVSDDNELLLASRIYRHLAPAFELRSDASLAWAFPTFGSDALRQAADRYLQRIRTNGTLQRLLEHYYGHAGRLNFVDKRAFQRHLRERLPALRPFFEQAERQTGIDWRLLAAIAYQESHWNPKAVSPTGVRGVMMLTQDTARLLGVSDRVDPRQSILGGARYLRIVEQKIPERITEPDRLWLTLAGYNIGFGHLEDARILTQKAGGDPDRWTAVREHLPRLNRKKLAGQLRYGNANGVQAVEYVENIRNYYDLMVWYDNHPEDLAIQEAPRRAQSSPLHPAR